jgi:hypothetical protein
MEGSFDTRLRGCSAFGVSSLGWVGIAIAGVWTWARYSALVIFTCIRLLCYSNVPVGIHACYKHFELRIRCSAAVGLVGLMCLFMFFAFVCVQILSANVFLSFSFPVQAHSLLILSSGNLSF